MTFKTRYKIKNIIPGLAGCVSCIEGWAVTRWWPVNYPVKCVNYCKTKKTGSQVVLRF
jgi:hypothetical protein